MPEGSEAPRLPKIELPLERQAKERERSAHLKALREQLEEELERTLPFEGEEARVRDEMQALSAMGPLADEEGKQVLESLLFSSSKPLSRQALLRILAGEKASTIERWAKELAAEYVATSRAFRLREVALGYEISTEPAFAPWIAKLEREKRVKQATQSALETLSIIAYKQPCTRAEVEDLRGVNVSGVLSTLVERGLTRVSGRKEVAGRPLLYATTDAFLEHFGLKSLADLPKISEIKDLVQKSFEASSLLRKEVLVSQPVSDSGSGPGLARGPQPQYSPGVQAPGEWPSEARSLDTPQGINHDSQGSGEPAPQD